MCSHIYDFQYIFWIFIIIEFFSRVFICKFNYILNNEYSNNETYNKM